MTEPAEAANPPSAPKRALLAWEFGSGRTHIANLLGVAARLRGAGVECVAALYDMRFADEFAALGVAAVQNYVWPARRRAPFGWQEQEVRTVGDALANLGFADPPSLRGALDHYDGLFALFRPDVVLCENAFGGVLAARNRRPVIAFGTGSCLPPIDGPGFPLREGYQGQPAWPEDFVTGRINEALASRGREPLRHFSDIFGIEGVHPFGPLEFDLYAAKRRAPMLPPHLPAIERPLPSGPSDEIFVYLHGFVQANEKVMAGLRAIDRPMRLYMPELVPDQRDRFPASCRIESQAVPPADIVRRARCVIHHGGPQLTTLCLVAGKCGGSIGARRFAA